MFAVSAKAISKLFRLLILALPLLFTSCLPGTWLPDSSGFVFVEGDQIFLFDLKTKKRRAITKLPSPDAKFAVMPKGDKIVVSH